MVLVALSVSSSARAVLASLAPRAASMRGYAASAASGAMRRAAEGAAGAGEAKEAGRAAAAEISWVPDPVTGHYRPANWAAAVDPADLRAAHLARSYARA
ncbi:late embryogenis abundant protein 2-like [Miscanthus floridulus]|uniref:late embryogenis abundant protein 2-like n=1 Tax=Miscanthus floridulus TaxID=154761 RepID=UPI0034597C0E